MEMNSKRSNKRAVIYGRFSFRKKTDRSESCEKQIELCQRYCNHNNLEVVGVYSDQNNSAASPANRPGLQLALHKTVKKQAVLVIESLSSLSWNTKEIIEIIKRLEHAKAGLCCTSEQIDTTKENGRYFFKTAALFVKLEHKLLSERTSNTMIRQQQAGHRMSYLPPYGTMIDPKDSTKLIINDYEQKAINRMIELHQAGTSFRAIARQLTEEGYKPRHKQREFKGRLVNINGKWRHDHIARIIRRQEKV